VHRKKLSGTEGAAACCDAMNWYAIHTKPRQEGLAESSLHRESVETFYPKLKRKRTIRRVRKWVTSPLFPCYIFAKFDTTRQARLVKYANGVTNIVSFGGQPAIVDDWLLASIKEHAEQDVVTIEPAKFQAGELVEIQTGPLRGLQGIFEREMSDSDRVVILLDALAKGARVQVDRELLEKVG